HDGLSLLSLTLFTGIGYGTVLTIYIQCLFSLVHSPMRQALRLFFFGYASTMFVIETLYVAANSRRVWIAFVINWGSVVGPSRYEIGLWHDWASIAAMACYIISNWLADALVLGRCMILLRNMKNRRWLIPIPCSVFLVVIGTRVHGREYNNIIMMTTESCMISAISSIVYLVLYAMNNFVQYPFMVIQNQMQVIALFVLILRIIQGKAWTRRTD
ncbi:hypothetical protein EDD22DRAFT_754122, partial [Suillus occidentalis]